MRPSNTDLRIKVPLASVLAELLICTLAGKLCRLSVNLIPELIRCHLDDSVLEQNVILRRYRQMVEILILASYFPGLLEKWGTRRYSEFLGNVHTWKISKFRIFVRLERLRKFRIDQPSVMDRLNSNFWNIACWQYYAISFPCQPRSYREFGILTPGILAAAGYGRYSILLVVSVGSIGKERIASCNGLP